MKKKFIYRNYIFEIKSEKINNNITGAGIYKKCKEDGLLDVLNITKKAVHVFPELIITIKNDTK
jgi:hypothetical protein